VDSFCLVVMNLCLDARLCGLMFGHYELMFSHYKIVSTL
jgi:hypothetical protein